MELSTQQKMFAHNVAKLINKIYDAGYTCSLGEAFRTEAQAKLDAECGTGIINSQHCKRLAIDLNLFLPSGKYASGTEDYATLGAYWETLDPLNRWGGHFTRGDGNHFEMKDAS
jgi:D-alanyl-D-alanine carboxypeptidase